MKQNRFKKMIEKIRTAKRHESLEGRLRKLMLWFFVPVSVMIVVIFAVLFSYVTRYKAILHNVTTASEFNQDFKESIDLKMYYYVVDSHYSEGLPIEEVQAAQKLARNLLETTTQKESWKAINGVLNLCTNLESKIYLIEETPGYDERQLQLENNIYVLTKLIQEYMYTYLYHEAALLDTLQTQMTERLYLEVAVILLTAEGLLFFLIHQLLRLGRAITKPISNLCARVQAIGDGDLNAKTPIQAEAYEIQTLSDGFEDMVSRLNQQIEQNRQEQISLRSAELALLQAQINPHFLYNTLDAIVWLIEMEKNEQAVEMVTSLSGFFRSSLSKGRDIITLREEEQHVRSYLEIQKVRYKDILDYQIEMQPELEQYEIPKLTLQPLVENALYHGIKLKRGQGHIRVQGRLLEQEILLTVEDDGAGMSPQRLEQVRQGLEHRKQVTAAAVGFGAATVHERLQLLFGPEYGLRITSEEGVGTRVEVRIPKHRQIRQEAESYEEKKNRQSGNGAAGCFVQPERLRQKNDWLR